jgi:hypothetical protein
MPLYPRRGSAKRDRDFRERERFGVSGAGRLPAALPHDQPTPIQSGQTHDTLTGSLTIEPVVPVRVPFADHQSAP